MSVHLQDLQFKLATYSSSVFASGTQQQYGPRRSEDGSLSRHMAAFPIRATGLA